MQYIARINYHFFTTKLKLFPVYLNILFLEKNKRFFFLKKEERKTGKGSGICIYLSSIFSVGTLFPNLNKFILKQHSSVVFQLEIRN
jgi:hypothetical protein